MSDTGLHSADISQLRRLGSLVDSVIVGANTTADVDFKRSCDELLSVLESATARPIRDLRSLVLAELLNDYLKSTGDQISTLRASLRQRVIDSASSALLEGLARNLERERTTATSRMRPGR